MKRTDLIRKLKKNGWWLLRHGANHDIYTNGTLSVAIPRHGEINEKLAQAIVRKYLG